MELPVYVAAYCDWSIDLDDVAFFDEELPGFVAEFANLRFGDCSAGAEFRYCTRRLSVDYSTLERGFNLLI